MADFIEISRKNAEYEHQRILKSMEANIAVLRARAENSEELARKKLQQASATAELRSALEKQVGGAHYKDLGAYQPWLVLKASMTEDEFRGYMKGTALVYLLRAGKKGADDIEKACHTLEGYLELCKQN